MFCSEAKARLVAKFFFKPRSFGYSFYSFFPHYENGFVRWLTFFVLHASMCVTSTYSATTYTLAVYTLTNMVKFGPIRSHSNLTTVSSWVQVDIFSRHLMSAVLLIAEITNHVPR
jgi:hypothetical protein